MPSNAKVYGQSAQSDPSESLSNLLGMPAKQHKEYAQFASASGPFKSGTGQTINLKSSDNARQSLFWDTDAQPRLFTASQVAMIQGVEKSPGDPTEISYTVENKLTREKILAALRRLRAGEIAQADFQERLHHLGFDLPDAMLSELNKMVRLFLFLSTCFT